MCEFNYNVFLGGYDSLAVNKEKYTKEQAIEIAKAQLNPYITPYYIAVRDGYVRYNKYNARWYLEYGEYPGSLPCWLFHVTFDKHEIYHHLKTCEYIQVSENKGILYADIQYHI